MNFVEVSPGKFTPAFLEGDENRLKVFYIQEGEGASVEVWKHGSIFKFKFKEVFLPEPDQVYMGNESKENIQQIFMTDGDAIQLNFILENAEGEQNQKLVDIEISKSSNRCK
jgi:hypothetical protein